MTEQTPEIVARLQREIAAAAEPLIYPATAGAELHERGSFDGVLDKALEDATNLGTGWIRIRFRKVDTSNGLAGELAIGDWTLDAPDPTQIVEVVRVVAGEDATR